MSVNWQVYLVEYSHRVEMSVYQGVIVCSGAVDRMVWTVSRRRCLSSTSWPDHIAVERSGTALNCVAARPLRFVSDSLLPLTDDPVATTDSEKDGMKIIKILST